MADRSRFLKLIPFLAAFAAIYLIWGSTYLAVAVAVKTIPPFALMGVRSLLAGSLLLAVALLHQEKISIWRDGRIAAASGLLLFLGCHGLLAYAQTRIESGVAAIILATIPFWIILSKLIMPREKERPSLATLAALVPGLVGVALVAWPSKMAGWSELPLMLVLLLAAASWSLGTVISQRHESALSAAGLSGLQLLCGGAALLLVSALAGEHRQFSLREVTTGAWTSLVYLILAGSVLTFTAYNWLLDHVEAPLVATYTFVNPAVAVLLGWLVLGERLSLSMLAGFALVILSIIGVWALDNPKLAETAKQAIGNRFKRRAARTST
jgi:drug/metabolite transporter (DMT)-like permease